jgi:hypothetical protein
MAGNRPPTRKQRVAIQRASGNVVRRASLPEYLEMAVLSNPVAVIVVNGTAVSAPKVMAVVSATTVVLGVSTVVMAVVSAPVKTAVIANPVVVSCPVTTPVTTTLVVMVVANALVERISPEVNTAVTTFGVVAMVWAAVRRGWRPVGEFTRRSRTVERFYAEWRPRTLADERGAPILQGGWYIDEQEWLQRLENDLFVEFDKWYSQPVYMEIWFEARAMVEQFRQYAPGITLVPFGGEFTTNLKRETASRLSAMAEKYDTPVQVFYFGDYDPKGLQILDSALKDIKAWCHMDFGFERVGLTLEEAVRMGVPENFEKPGEYQWEALTDGQARTLIESVTNLVDRQAWEEVERREEEAAEAVRELIRRELLANNGGNAGLSDMP